MHSNKKIAVRYYSKTGNTKKLAEAIAEIIGIKAESVDVPLDQEVDILFLGSSVYAAGVNTKVKLFIHSLDSRVKNVVNFSTAAIITSTYPQIKKLLDEKGISLDEREFHCRGAFTFMHRGKPDESDIQNVQAFAKTFLL